MVNQDLIVDGPKGDNWRFSLDPTADVSSFQMSRRFQTDAAGAAFVDGQTYTVLAYDTDSTVLLSQLVTFYSGPASTALTDPALIPDFRGVTHRGNATDIIIEVAGLEVPNWDIIQQATHVLVPVLVNGKERTFKLPMSALSVGGGTAPVTPPTITYLPGKAYKITDKPVAPPAVTFTVGKAYKIVDTATAPPPAPLVACELRFDDLSAGNATGVHNGELLWTRPNPQFGQTADEIRRSTVSADGPWETPVSVLEGYLFLDMPYNIPSWYQQRNVYGTVRQSPWSNSVKALIVPPAVLTLVAHFSRHGVGSPPPKLSDLADGDSFDLLTNGQNFSVLITDDKGNIPPSTAYAGITFDVYEAATNQRRGWSQPDYNVKPSPVPVYAFPTSGLVTNYASAYTLDVKAFTASGGTVAVSKGHIGFNLTKPAAAVNHAPTAPATLPMPVFNLGQVTYYSLPKFTDPDPGDTLTHSAIDLPPWLDFYPTGSLIGDGSLPWIAVSSGGVPNSTPLGPFTFGYVATDNHGAQTIVRISCQVYPAN